MTRLIKTKENINGLPLGFKEVEYLQSTGGSYIDTGIGVKSDTVVKAIFSIPSTATGRSYFGARNSSNERFQIVNSFGVGGGYFYNANIYPIANQKYEIEMHANGDIYLDGVKRNATNGTFSPVAFDRSLYIFSTNYYDDSGVPSASTFWKVQILEGDVLVRDFIPCLDGNNTPCMWDKVEKKPYYNAGSGTFGYGRQIIPVEYLQSSGTQYIDTGIKGKNNIDFDYKVNFTNVTTSSGYGIGGEWESQKSLYLGLIRSNGNFAYHYANTNAPVVVLNSVSANTDYSIQGHMWSGEQYMTINGTKSAVGTITGTFESTQNITLFRVTSSSPIYCYAKIYYLKIWDNNTLVRDFIPCIDENNTPYMFDKATHTAYLNAGTGSFSYGNPIYTTKTRLIKEPLLPNGFRRVEYLEGTGTQYINTGLVSTENSTVDLAFSFTSMESGIANNVSVFGGRNAQQSTTFTLFKIASATPQYFRFDYNGQVNVGSASQLTWNTSSKYRFTYNGTTRTIENVTTGEKVTANLSPATSYTTQPIYLFAANTLGNAGQFMKGRIYGYEYSDGTNTIKLVPAINSSNRPCMYDLVSGTAYYNQGSGEFNYGNVLPEKARLIPSWLDDYTFVNYIQSTGTQYINTGVTLTNNHSVEIDYQLTQASQSRAGLFGNLNMTGSNQGRFGSILSPSNQQLEHGYGTGNDYWQQGSPDTNRHKLYQKKNEIYFDGTLIHTFASATFTLNTTALLGNFVYTNYTPAKAKYYNSKWWNGDTLIRNFIPAIRKSDNAVGMLDIVNRVFYTNQGTGVFSYG